MHTYIYIYIYVYQYRLYGFTPNKCGNGKPLPCCVRWSPTNNRMKTWGPADASAAPGQHSWDLWMFIIQKLVELLIHNISTTILQSACSLGTFETQRVEELGLSVLQEALHLISISNLKWSVYTSSSQLKFRDLPFPYKVMTGWSWLNPNLQPVVGPNACIAFTIVVTSWSPTQSNKKWCVQ